LQRARLDWQDIGSFYLKRGFRIYPALFLACAVGLAYWLLFRGQPFGSLVDEWFTDSHYRSDASPTSIVLTFLGLDRTLPLPIWSIFVELLGSLLLPFLVIAQRWRPAAFWVLVALLAIYSLLGPSLRMSAGVYLVDFALGSSIALWGTAATSWLSRRAGILGLVSAASLLFMTFVRQVGPWPFDLAYHHPVPALLEAAAATLLIACLVAPGGAPRFLLSRPLVFLGDISYSLYLLHLPVLALLAGIGGDMLGLPLFTADPNLASAALLLLVLMICIPLAALSYRYIELPGIALGRQAVAAWQAGTRRRGIGAAAAVDNRRPPQ
jgi:peptidoglycan/LPS O-acetylase OafA/YrhL